MVIRLCAFAVGITQPMLPIRQFCNGPFGKLRDRTSLLNGEIAESKNCQIAQIYSIPFSFIFLNSLKRLTMATVNPVMSINVPSHRRLISGFSMAFRMT